MKKLILTAISAIALFSSSILFTSCEGDKQGIEITVNQDNIQIMKLLPTTTLRVDTTELITSNLDSLLAQNDLTRDDIARITLASITVDVCDSLGNIYPSGVNFNEFDSVGINVSVPNDNTVPSVLVASSSVPRNLIGFGVGLTQEDFDFIPYVTKQQFQVRFTGKLNAPIVAKKYVRVKVRIDVVGVI